MSKKLYFLISFVLALGLNGTVHGDAIDVNNHSFEYDINVVPITQQTWLGALQGWTLRDTTGWGGGWLFADDDWEWSDGYEAADGNVCIFHVTTDEPNDPNSSCQIYQILDPNVDPNAVIAENRRYTLTFNALRMGTDDIPTVYGALFYSVGGVNVAPADDVILASKEEFLTSPPWGEPDYAGWEEIKMTYTAVGSADSIGERLGVKLSVPAHIPWLYGYQVVMDNVRVDWVWATDAWGPYPADGARDVAKDVTLAWNVGAWVQATGGHEVYFGTDEAAVQDANTNWAEYQGTEDGNTWSVLNYNAGGLELGRTYYWRVDEVNESYSGSNPPPPPNGRWKGPVWSFRATGYATNPSPADGAVDVPFLGQALMWTAGTEATSHDVYLGDDADAVADANTNSPEYEGNQTVGNTTYPLTGLTVGQTYYWRIDEQSLVHPSGLKGDIWSFTVGPFLIVDNFDSYDNLEPDLWAVWDDFWVNGSDGEIALVKADANAIRSGHSMELVFYNVTESPAPDKYFIGSWTDAQDMTELEIGSDWTIGGIKALTLYLRGDPCNIDSMYGVVSLDWGAAWPWVELEDTSSNIGLVKVDDPNVVLNDGWYEWNIDLAIFDACGVTLSAIDRIGIGVGGVRTGQAKATPNPGHIYIEDIRVYPPRCRSDVEGIAYFNSKGDFSGPDGVIDCGVDYFDIEVMATEWLVSDYNAAGVAPAAPPEVWYRFDDGPGSTVVKNSGGWGSQYHIPIDNPPASDEPAWTTDVAPALDVCDPNYALDFDGENDYLEIPNSPATNFAGTENMTITTWVKGVATPWSTLVCSATAEPRHATGLGFGDEAGDFMYFWNESEWWWDPGLDVPDNQWTFMAIAIEPTHATAYVSDGTTIETAKNVVAHGPLEDFDTDCFTVLADDSKGGGYFDGIMDDVRLYNKTLTMPEIVGLAGISETYMPNTSVANIAPKDPPPGNYDPNDPDIVNFLDYAKQADNWLDEFLWP
jgi:hypothetical protein